ncbi:helix-turn-helix domain-containing protein, partial [Pseudactinotalea sp.]|uniref:helix-turn-helix domain-containing protein n=1 Tax=Pseudactinotalea sp. TaxID=1926260 RepID=UPI003B3BC694
IMRTLEHVDAHLSEPLTVRHLAGVARLSVSRFAHLFAEQLGSSPSAYVERKRMAWAKLLLDLTGRSGADVAGSVGNSDPLYFSTRFRHVEGASPTAYRARAARGR